MNTLTTKQVLSLPLDEKLHLVLASEVSTEEQHTILADDPNPQVRIALATHSTYSTVLHKLALKERDQNLLAYLTHNPRTAPETLDICADKLTVEEGRYYMLSLNLNTSTETLKKLYEDYLSEGGKNEAFLLNLAVHPNASLDILRKIFVRTLDVMVFLKIVERPEELPGDFLNDIYACANLNIPGAGARAVTYKLIHREDAPDSLLQEILEAGEYVWGVETLNVVAGHRNASPQTLALLVQSKNWAVRYRAAQNPNIDVALLNVLAFDHDDALQEGVARNPKTPFYLLLHFMKTGTDEVSYAAYDNFSRGNYTLKELEKCARIAISDHDLTLPGNLSLSYLKDFILTLAGVTPPRKEPTPF